MTGKRFQVRIDTENIIDTKTNEEFKITIGETVRRLNHLHEENQKLKKENKELKAKVDDNEVAVEVETCKVMEKIFDLIDKKIKELEDKYEFGRTKYGACPMHNIMFGINVLKELKKELAE